MAAVRQFTFAAGELAEKLHGRSDLELYKRGLKTCRNFFPTVDGQVVSRPGSLFVKETKGSAAGGINNQRVRLLPFVFSGGQTYVLEFGTSGAAGYVRFHSNGGTIESSPGVPYEIVSPYGYTSLQSLQFAQVGNVMYLTQAGYDAYRLERFSHTSWTLTPVSYTPRAWPGLPYTEPRLDPITFRGFSGFMSPPMLETSADFVGDASHPVQEWIWALTLEGQDTKTGKRFESLPYVIDKKYDGVDTYPGLNGTVALLADHFVALYSDKKVVLSSYRWTIGTAPDFLVLGINVYRGRGGDMYGLVGRTLRAKFVDRGDEPNFAIQPPLGTNPFKVFAADGSLIRTEKPIAVAFFGDRLVFAGAHDNDKLIRAASLFFSSQGQWDRFDRYPIPFATMAMEFDLAVNTRQEVRTALSSKTLLIGTDGGVHSIRWPEGVNATVVPDTRLEASVGCSHLRMLEVKGTPLFAEGYQADTPLPDGFASGLAVHAIDFTGVNEGYRNKDLSWQASHLLYGDGGSFTRVLRDWCYAKRPWQLVWAVRDDGQLLSLTFEPTTGQVGWAHHDTDGAYENICTVPELGEDAVYAVVRRTVAGVTRRYIERLTSRSKLGGSIIAPITGAIAQHMDFICLDSAKYYYGAPTNSISGLDHLEGKPVWVLREGKPPIGPITVNAGTIALPGPLGGFAVNELTYVGLKYTPELETLSVGGEPEKNKTLKGLLFWVKDTKGLRAGPELVDAKLKPVKALNPAIGYATTPTRTELIRVDTMGSWDEHARAALRQDLPLPCTLIQLTRLIEGGDAR